MTDIIVKGQKIFKFMIGETFCVLLIEIEITGQCIINVVKIVIIPLKRNALRRRNTASSYISKRMRTISMNRAVTKTVVDISEN